MWKENSRELFFGKPPHDQVGTENPIHMSDRVGVGIRTWVLRGKIAKDVPPRQQDYYLRNGIGQLKLWRN